MQIHPLLAAIWQFLLWALTVAGLLFGFYKGFRAGRDWYRKRHVQRIYAEAEQKMLENPPPPDYGIGRCISVPVDPSNPVGKVRYAIVRDYSVLDLPGVERIWMLHCDDGRSYMHTQVFAVPGGYPDQTDERSGGGNPFLPSEQP